MNNPRFPHSLKIQTAQKDNNGDIVFDEEGNPTFLDTPVNVVKYDEKGLPIRDRNGQFITEEKTVIPFGYRDSTRSVNVGQVDVAQLHIATPLLIYSIKDGDILILSDWDRTYKAKVVRKSNTNFGSDIWIDEVKN